MKYEWKQDPYIENIIDSAIEEEMTKEDIQIMVDEFNREFEVDIDAQEIIESVESMKIRC
jgi:hypothetical protein